MADNGSIAAAIKQIVGDQRIYSDYATVESVDMNKQTCVVSLVDNPEIKFFATKLAVNSDATYVEYPKVGSLVFIHYLDDTTAYVVKVNEVDGYYIGNAENSLMDMLLALSKAVQNIQLTHPQGPTTPMGVINLTDFTDFDNTVKNLFKK